MNRQDSCGTIELLSDPADPDGAALTFRRNLRRIQEAQRSIAMHMFVWRNDASGNEVGRALLEAADRGVAVHIKKDTGAIIYSQYRQRLELSIYPSSLQSRAAARVSLRQDVALQTDDVR